MIPEILGVSLLRRWTDHVHGRPSRPHPHPSGSRGSFRRARWAI